jgi:hydroxyethylthiazole kinase
MKTLNEHVADVLERVRQEQPLIHHITNFVTMNDVANVTMHVGAKPVMAFAAEEVGAMTGTADALLLNLGTLSIPLIESMLIAGEKARYQDIPIVLDPVGAGATMLRTRGTRRLLDELKIQIIRGNPGEIGVLSGRGGSVRGVDSETAAEDSATTAHFMARSMDHSGETVVAITGQRDIVANNERVLAVDNGHHWLTTITGTGCMVTAIIAAFAAVEHNYLLATVGALAVFGLAAELAAPHAQGPGSFKVALFDQLYNLTGEQVVEGVRISEQEVRG